MKSILVLVAILLVSWSIIDLSHCFFPIMSTDMMTTSTTGTTSVADIKCGNLNCGSGDKCCSNNWVGGYYRCYDPSKYTCRPDLYNKHKNCLCSKGDGCCKGTCFDTKHYYCDHGKVKKKNLCGDEQCKSWEKCCLKVTWEPGQCYSGNERCVHDQYWTKYNCVCWKGQGCCKGKCYYTSSHYCDKGKVKKKPNCGHYNCKSWQKCCLKVTWEPGKCYSGNQRCVHDQYWTKYNCVCSKGQSCCKGKCFWPSTWKCSKGKLVKKH